MVQPLRFLAGAVCLAACSSASTLKPFSSDGCSLFPDADLISSTDWCQCCFAHDIAYWRGGTLEERLEADEQLRDCVLAKTGNTTLAAIMHLGVQFGGSPYFYSWYRWGYGWSYDRAYQALSITEAQRADKLLQLYSGSEKRAVCLAQTSE